VESLGEWRGSIRRIPEIKTHHGWKVNKEILSNLVTGSPTQARSLSGAIVLGAGCLHDGHVADVL
jgi:hypothetical protein